MAHGIQVIHESMHKWSTVKPALATTCVQRPPLSSGQAKKYQLTYVLIILPVSKGHLSVKATVSWDIGGRFRQVSLYMQRTLLTTRVKYRK